MRDSIRKKLVDWGVLDPSGQTRREAFSLTNMGSIIGGIGLASLLLWGFPEGGWTLVVSVAFVVFGLVLTVIGVLRQGSDKDKEE